VIAVGQALPASGAIAVVVAFEVVTVTSAKSCAPELSVMVSRSVKLPVIGACTVATASLAPVIVGGAPVDEKTVHA
jgi:hypothetical protein